MWRPQRALPVRGCNKIVRRAWHWLTIASLSCCSPALEGFAAAITSRPQPSSSTPANLPGAWPPSPTGSSLVWSPDLGPRMLEEATKRFGEVIQSVGTAGDPTGRTKICRTVGRPRRRPVRAGAPGALSVALAVCARSYVSDVQIINIPLLPALDSAQLAELAPSEKHALLSAFGLSTLQQDVSCDYRISPMYRWL